MNNIIQKIVNSLNTSPSTALERFQRSMQIDYLKWHDGIGYDLGALKKLKGDELRQAEAILISRKDQDWRDVEALASLKTPAAIEALKECLHSPNPDVRLFAVRYLKEMNVVDRVEQIVVDTLPMTGIGHGMTFALALAKKYPSERIKQQLLWCCLHGNDDIRIHCAAMSLYLYGKASSEFDKRQKIIFRLGIRDFDKRIEAFQELCQIIGVDPDRFISEGNIAD
jgi:hypothetical protein